MLIFRVERDGQGAFASSLVYDVIERPLHGRHGADPRNPPGPDGEHPVLRTKFRSISGKQRANTLFGFASLDQYKAWFSCPRLRKDLDARRGQLVVYDVPEKYVTKGYHQVIFDIRKAKFVAVLPCTTRRRKFTITKSKERIAA